MCETVDAQPKSISQLCGQSGVIDQVLVALDAAQIDGKKFDDSLLVGPPGCGKSQVASVIANEMAEDCHEVLGQSLSSLADLNALLLQASHRSVVHIDECHELDKSIQTALYLALDKRILFIGGRGRTPQGIPIANFTLLLSTTDEYCLLQPLRDRMKLTLRFQFYSDAELAKLTYQRAVALGWDVSEDVIPSIAKRGRGTPRIALRLLQSCRRVARSLGAETITMEHLVRACELEGIDEAGLVPTEQQYLSILAEGSSRLNVIASRIGLPTRTVSEVTESFLIRSGLIEKDDQGRRQLTAHGRMHLSQSRKNTT
ncbi:Holliday junction DNA helicase RuvB C-terminal domain-containing protein [Rosistilla oblonga]|uniref:Holliday junction DNA helicase RuvB C-terminal domain-containing protein n=1 Tax=Rosistilla oblonga TaxID=2527990 RepID=UPI003A982A7B